MPPAPPHGTITLLFSDIEGSTRLLQESGDLYPDLLLAHRTVLRQAFAAHDGYEVDIAGDGFFVVFSSASQAASAAAAGHRALSDMSWPGGHQLRVRMGLHTGEPRLVDSGYIGLDVHRAARVMAAAHGGQVVLTQATRELLGPGFDVRDLGEHRLKDLTGPQRLYQLIAEGLDTEFPALRTLEGRRTNLPMQASPLIGRLTELREVGDMLTEARLLTLIGPGGIGKTRLALQAAADVVDSFPDGVFLVPLARLRDAELVVPAIADALGLRQGSRDETLELISEHLEARSVLLVLDNFEHVLRAAPSISSLLGTARSLRVLATSRERLRIDGEQQYPVPPLSLLLPAATNERRLPEAVQLFAVRAQAADPSFAISDENVGTILRICERLDGLPLAIELAAARSASLGLHALASRLDRRLTWLKGGRRDEDARQATLEATIEWSYDLLTAGEQRLFRRLGVCDGGARLEAVEALADAVDDVVDDVVSLVEKSLIVKREDPDGQPRFLMLETIREFASSRLRRAGDETDARRLHASHYSAVVVQLGAELDAGPVEPSTIALLNLEEPNARACLAQLDADESDHLASVVASLWRYWRVVRTSPADCLHWAERVLAVSTDPATRAFFLAMASDGAQMLGLSERAERAGRQALELAEQLNDARTQALAWWVLGNSASRAGAEAEDTALARYHNSVDAAERASQPWVAAFCLCNMADILMRRGELDRARPLAERGKALGAESGDDEALLTNTVNLAAIALQQGRLDEAQAEYAQALTLARRMNAAFYAAWIAVGVALLAGARGDRRRAAVLLGFAQRLLEDTAESFGPVEAEMVAQATELVDELQPSERRAAFESGRTLDLAAGLDLAHASVTPRRPARASAGSP